MISWIQRTFQQHFRTVFAVLLAITIISFIVTIGATPGIGRADHRVVSRNFFGYNLASRDDMQRIINDGQLSAELRFGGGNEEQVKTYALQRVAALHLANQWRLPPPGPEEMKSFIEGLRLFAGENGQFDAQRYARFREGLASSSQ